MHSHDYRISSGGFIHGFRYLIKLFMSINYNIPYTKKIFEILNFQDMITLSNHILTRINNSSNIYQMFKFLGDIFYFNATTRKITYYENVITNIEFEQEYNLKFVVTLEFGKKEIIVKYQGQYLLTKILEDGSEIPIEINYYDNNQGKKIYIHEGVSFTLNDKKRYFFPSKKEDLKSGMLIEYFNNNMWYQKKVDNLDTEYEKMYKLLMKYEKLRVCY
jgi:hypothetical protein